MFLLQIGELCTSAHLLSVGETGVIQLAFQNSVSKVHISIVLLIHKISPSNSELVHEGKSTETSFMEGCVLLVGNF